MLFYINIILKRFTLKHYKIGVRFDFFSLLNWGHSPNIFVPNVGNFSLLAMHNVALFNSVKKVVYFTNRHLFTFQKFTK